MTLEFLNNYFGGPKMGKMVFNLDNGQTFFVSVHYYERRRFPYRRLKKKRFTVINLLLLLLLG